MNVFILTNAPRKAIELAKKSIGRMRFQLGEVKAAYRRINSEDFTSLWPEDLNEFEVI